jgi:hypothetical protein
MQRRKQLFLYLLLNILVSALTTLGVLWWWERGHTARPVLSAAFPARNGAATTSLPPLNEPTLQIKNVFGVGDVQQEVVLLEHIGSSDLWLTGWQISAESDQTFTFPSLLLHNGSTVQVYTGSGQDTVLALHWGLDQPIWQAGQLVTLLDPQGNVRATYRIP